MATGKSSDTPSLGGPDTLEIKRIEHPFSFPDGEDKELHSLIVDAVDRMGGVGDDAEDRYQAALESLRKRADDVLEAVIHAYQALPEDGYLDRWSLVHLVAELRSPRALGFLDEVVASAIPDERYPDSHDLTTVTEEVMIRTTAVDGIVRLSADGLEEARGVLLRQARNPQFSIRRACVQGLMETGTEKDQEELRAILRENGDERLLEIRRMDVREVPQATGGLFLVHPDLKDQVPPHDLGTTRREG